MNKETTALLNSLQCWRLHAKETNKNTQDGKEVFESASLGHKQHVVTQSSTWKWWNRHTDNPRKRLRLWLKYRVKVLLEKGKTLHKALSPGSSITEKMVALHISLDWQEAWDPLSPRGSVKPSLFLSGLCCRGQVESRGLQRSEVTVFSLRCEWGLVKTQWRKFISLFPSRLGQAALRKLES